MAGARKTGKAATYKGSPQAAVLRGRASRLRQSADKPHNVEKRADLVKVAEEWEKASHCLDAADALLHKHGAIGWSV